MKRDELAREYAKKSADPDDWSGREERAYAAGFDACLELVLGELRSEDAPRNMGGLYPYNHSWAEWLSTRLGGEK